MPASWRIAGLCYDLNELAETYCPDFWDDVDPLQQLNNQAGDRKIYTLRNGYFNNDFYADPRIPIDPPWDAQFQHDAAGWPSPSYLH